MNTTMTSERMMSMGMGNMGGMMGMPMMGRMGMSSEAGSMPGMMIPRCTMKIEKCPGGMKMTCMCDDKTAAMMMPGMTCCMMMNGMPVCCCVC